MSLRRAFSYLSLAARLPLTLSLVALLAAQSEPPSPPLVNLNVAAVDGSGSLVTGLRAPDFQILDDGKPQKIVWFHALATQAHDGWPGTGQHSNRDATAAPATFILLDLFNVRPTPFDSEVDAKQLSAKIADAVEKLGPGDGVYLYVLTPEAKIVLIHGNEPETQLDGSPWTRLVKPKLDEILRQMRELGTQQGVPLYKRIVPTWRALSGLVLHMAEIPGPKSFVWVTEGVPYKYREPGRRARTSYVYDADPLHEFAANLSAVEAVAYSVTQPSLVGWGDSRSIGDGPKMPGDALDTLDQLSALTGGRVYRTDDDMGKAIRQAASDAQSINYRIAFSPGWTDGKYHKIRVTVARKDIRIRAAERYYAVPDLDAGPRQEAIEAAAGSGPFDFPEIGLTASVYPVEGTSGEFRFAVKVYAPDVMLLKDGTRYKGSLAVALVSIGEHGERTISPGTQVNLDMSLEEYTKALKDGIEISQKAGLSAGARHVRVVAVDRRSELAGTVTMPLDRKQ